MPQVEAPRQGHTGTTSVFQRHPWATFLFGSSLALAGGGALFNGIRTLGDIAVNRMWENPLERTVRTELVPRWRQIASRVPECSSLESLPDSDEFWLSFSQLPDSETAFIRSLQGRTDEFDAVILEAALSQLKALQLGHSEAFDALAKITFSRVVAQASREEWSQFIAQRFGVDDCSLPAMENEFFSMSAQVQCLSALGAARVYDIASPQGAVKIALQGSGVLRRLRQEDLETRNQWEAGYQAYEKANPNHPFLLADPEKYRAWHEAVTETAMARFSMSDSPPSSRGRREMRGLRAGLMVLNNTTERAELVALFAERLSLLGCDCQLPKAFVPTTPGENDCQVPSGSFQFYPISGEDIFGEASLPSGFSKK